MGLPTMPHSNKATDHDDRIEPGTLNVEFSWAVRALTAIHPKPKLSTLSNLRIL